jgi:class 3 adenylate cyclase
MTTAPLGNMELLSTKLAQHMPPDAWQTLFQGGGRSSIRFVRKQVAVLYAQPVALAACPPRLRESFVAKVKWLVGRHLGRLDIYMRKGATVFFEDPQDCLRMAIELQGCATGFPLRIGVHSGIADVATFETEGRTRCTLLGPIASEAMEVAGTAAIGSIVVSPACYAVVQDSLRDVTGDCLLMEEFMSTDIAQASITPAPAMGGQSTFAGLGLTAA